MRTAKIQDGEISFPSVRMVSRTHPLGVTLISAPIIGTEEYLEEFRKDLWAFEDIFLLPVINSYVVGAIDPDTDSGKLGNGVWSDLAHILGHKIIEERIPLKEYIDASLPLWKVLDFLGKTEEEYAETLRSLRNTFKDYATMMVPSDRARYRKILGIYLRIRYSLGSYLISSLRYSKLYSAMADATVEEVKKHADSVVIVDCFAFNKTVAKLKAEGYRIKTSSYTKFIKLAK